MSNNYYSEPFFEEPGTIIESKKDNDEKLVIEFPTKEEANLIIETPCTIEKPGITKSTRQILDNFKETVVDSRYLTNRPSAIKMGYVRKQD